MKQIFKFCLIVGLFCCATNPVFSQGSLRFIVVDSESNEPVPFASIYTTDGKIGTITNEKGIASVDRASLEAHSMLTISSVGYNTRDIMLNTIINNRGIVKLNPNTIFLNGILVFSRQLNQKDVQKLTKKAIKETQKSITPYAATGIYRHYIKQNGITTYASNSQFIIRDKIGMGKAQNPVILQEQVQFFNSIKSFDFTSRRLFFERAYLDTYLNKGNILLWNPLKYAITKDDHFYNLTDTIVNGNQIHYIINAQHLDTARYGIDIPFREGFDITYFMSFNPQSKDQFEINKIEVKYRMSQSFKKVSVVESSIWAMELRKTENVIFPYKISLQTNQIFKFSNVSESLILSSRHTFNISEAMKGHRSHIKVDSLNFRFDEKTIADLKSSSFYKSSMGFINKTNKYIDDEQLELKKVEAILEDGNNDKHIIFWDTYEVPYNHRHLLDDNQLVPLSDIIFINTNPDRNHWLFSVSGNSYDHFSQFHLPITYREVIKKYCNTVKVPLYVKISANQGVSCSEKSFIGQ